MGVASLHPIGAPYTQVFKPLGPWPACLFFFQLSSSKLGPALKKKTPPAAQTGLKDIYVGVASLHPICAPYTQVFKPLGLWPSCLFFF